MAKGIPAIGKAIRAARGKAKLTQAQLAEAVGVSNETISRIERGTYEPAVSTLLAISEALGLRIDSLVHGPLTAGETVLNTTPLVRRLTERAAQLDPEAVRALLRIAELLPARPAGYSWTRRQGSE